MNSATETALPGEGQWISVRSTLIGAQLREAVFQARHQLILGVVVRPDLGGDEEVVARHAAFGNRLAHFGFVAVDLRGVDHAVAHVQAVLHRVDDHLALQAEGAEAEDGDGGVVRRCHG
jgi:hypothetical protein